jgi:hypothetical protein
MTDNPDKIDTYAVAAQCTLQANRIMHLAAARDADAITELLTETGKRWGGLGIYALCCAFAETIKTTCYPWLPEGTGIGGDGGMMMIIPLWPNIEKDYPATMWAARFVTAYINQDADTCGALFAAELEDDTMTGVAELIAQVGHVIRDQS